MLCLLDLSHMCMGVNFILFDVHIWIGVRVYQTVKIHLSLCVPMCVTSCVIIVIRLIDKQSKIRFLCVLNSDGKLAASNCPIRKMLLWRAIRVFRIFSKGEYRILDNRN